MVFRSESSRPDGRDPWIGFHWVEHRGPTTVATRQQVDQLDTEGYFILDRAFHPDTMDDVTMALAIQTGDIELPTAARAEEPPADVLRRFCSHPLLAGLARDFIGPDASVGGDAAVVRVPGAAAPTSFSQDVVAGQSRPSQFITTWIALTDATADNGCLQIVRGRHRSGPLRFDLTDGGGSGHGPPTGRTDVDPADVVDVPVPAGSVVVMSSLTPRRVRPNVTDRSGVAYAIQYVRDVIDLDDHAAAADSRRRFPVVRGGQFVGPS